MMLMDFPTQLGVVIFLKSLTGGKVFFWTSSSTAGASALRHPGPAYDPQQEDQQRPTCEVSSVNEVKVRTLQSEVPKRSD